MSNPGICYLVGAGPGDLGLVTLRAKECVEMARSEEHTAELQSHHDLVCRLLLEKTKLSDLGPIV